MIHYQLRCEHGHRFESWFRSIAAFDSQCRAGLVECPECGSSSVGRALMAPAIASGLARPTEPAPAPAMVSGAGPGAAPPAAGPPGAASPAAVPPVASGGLPAATGLPPALRAALQKLRAEVESRCDHVGDRFAEEARAIHRGDSPARAIYGEATPEQAETLAEEGIEVARIPWVPRADG